MIAADVDGSGNLTMSDILEMQRVFLGHQEAYSVGKVWRFVDAAYNFQNPNRPLSEDFEEMTFDGSDLHAGLYFYTIQAGNYTGTQRMNVIR